MATTIHLPRLIGMIHLLPLPGAPRFGGSFASVVDRALADAEILAEAGFDGLMIENYGDVPFHRNAVGAETVAAMTRVACAVAERVSLPMGINVLRNDSVAALAIAAAVGAAFIRVNVHVGAYVTDQGIVQSNARLTLDTRGRLQSSARILADVRVKHAYRLGHATIEDEAIDALERGCADALIVSGNRTGAAADLADVLKIKRTTRAPVLVGSGVTHESIAETLGVCDGVIVGTCLKRGTGVDAELARRFVDAALS